MMRNYAIDVFRFFMMLGIVLLHIAALPAFWGEWRRLVYVLLPCVNGFVMISGYYGVKTNFRKIAALYATAVLCVVMVHCAFAPPPPAECVGGFGAAYRMARTVADLLKPYWFLHSYCFLLCFAPVVDMALFACPHKRDQIIMVAPVFAVVFGWGFMLSFIGVHHFVPPMPGLESHSGLTLLAVYVAGRLYKINEAAGDAIPIRVWILVFLLSGGLCTVGLGWFAGNNSPVAVIFALSSFHLAKRMKIPRFIGVCAAWLAPSMFSVYVFHANDLVYARLQSVAMRLVGAGFPVPFALSAVAVAAFAACIACDLPRRCFIHIAGRIGGLFSNRRFINGDIGADA